MLLREQAGSTASFLSRLLAAVAVVTAGLLPAVKADESTVSTGASLVMVVMDPLSKPLACPCVQGYAQRDYQVLADALSRQLGRSVTWVANESLASAMKKDTQGRADLVIGKHSVVLFDAQRQHLKLAPVAALTGKDGATTMTGLMVVPAADKAQTIGDLKGYRVILGPEECDEKHAAALTLLASAGVPLAVPIETSPACSDGALAILSAAQRQEAGAAVISSYARPLLEGCGTVPKGALRVVGETQPVPFVEAFVNQQLGVAEQDAIRSALLAVTQSPEVRQALETRDGFVELPVSATEKKKQVQR